MFVKYLICFLVSMVPLIELRGAVPIGLSNAFGEALPVLPLYITCIVGNMLPVPLIFFFARKVLVWGADKKYIGKFFKFCLEKGEKGGKKLQEKAGRLAASLLDLDFKKSSIAIMAGVILAGIIMGLASAGLFGTLGSIFSKA